MRIILAVSVFQIQTFYSRVSSSTDFQSFIFYTVEQPLDYLFQKSTKKQHSLPSVYSQLLSFLLVVPSPCWEGDKKRQPQPLTGTVTNLTGESLLVVTSQRADF